MPLDGSIQDYTDPIAALSPTEREQAREYLSWLLAFWEPLGSKGWFQGCDVATGREPGHSHRFRTGATHCLVSPASYESDLYDLVGSAMKALGFSDWYDAVFWNNDSETTFEMVRDRVRDALARLEAYDAI